MKKEEIVDVEVVNETSSEEKETSSPNKIEQTPNKLALLLITIFLGWLGIDKLYYSRGTKLGIFYFAIKFVSTALIVGLVWNILDIIFVITNSYNLNPIAYFNKEKASEIDNFIDNKLKD